MADIQKDWSYRGRKKKPHGGPTCIKDSRRINVNKWQPVASCRDRAPPKLCHPSRDNGRFAVFFMHFLKCTNQYEKIDQWALLNDPSSEIISKTKLCPPYSAYVFLRLGHRALDLEFPRTSLHHIPMPHEWCTLPLVRPTRYLRLLASGNVLLKDPLHIPSNMLSAIDISRDSTSSS